MKKILVIITVLICLFVPSFADSGESWLYSKGATLNEQNIATLVYENDERVMSFEFYDENADYKQYNNTFLFYDENDDMIAIYKIGFFKLICIYSDWD